MLEVRPSERLLDVATGSAELLAELARRPAAPRLANGIDSSTGMLALAPPLPRAWTLSHGDATELAFPDNSFDVLTATYLLHVLEPEQRHRVIAETARVLRPGGRLGVITVRPPRGPVSRTLLRPLLDAAQRSRGPFAGMRALDPAAELGEHGFSELARRRTLRGYPSLCLVAERSA